MEELKGKEYINHVVNHELDLIEKISEDLTRFLIKIGVSGVRYKENFNKREDLKLKENIELVACVFNTVSSYSLVMYLIHIGAEKDRIPDLLKFVYDSLCTIDNDYVVNLLRSAQKKK